MEDTLIDQIIQLFFQKDPNSNIAQKFIGKQNLEEFLEEDFKVEKAKLE